MCCSMNRTLTDSTQTLGSKEKSVWGGDDKEPLRLHSGAHGEPLHVDSQFCSLGLVVPTHSCSNFFSLYVFQSTTLGNPAPPAQEI